MQPAHFIERHGLIVIIAIGESLIAIGLGEREVGSAPELSPPPYSGSRHDVLLARLLRLLPDPRSATAERPQRRERINLARDVYSYLHLPMVADVLFAFALKTTLAHVSDELDTISALALCGGPALYLFSFVALRVRVSRTLGRGRLTAAVICALLWPVGVAVPALVALAVITTTGSLHAYELIGLARRAHPNTHTPPARIERCDPQRNQRALVGNRRPVRLSGVDPMRAARAGERRAKDLRGVRPTAPPSRSEATAALVSDAMARTASFPAPLGSGAHAATASTARVASSAAPDVCSRDQARKAGAVTSFWPGPPRGRITGTAAPRASSA